MDRSNISLFKSMVHTAFRDEVNPSEDQIEQIARSIKNLPYVWGDSPITEEVLAEIMLEIKEKYGVRMDLGHFLQGDNEGFEEWLDDQRSTIDWYYWNRYKQLLVQEGLPRDVIQINEERITKTLAQLGNPLDERASWDRRGMVVGSVQSGKTSNYIGLCAMAADAGYKVIVIIAGIHTSLRNQTQERVDQGLIGRDSTAIFAARGKGLRSRDHIVGVGHIDSSRYPTSFTNRYQDFSRQFVGVNEQLDPNRKEPYIFVIKKNPNTLGNLILWLRTNTRGAGKEISLPLLLIDDEADNASINIAYKADEVSRINGQIRDLLGLFSMSSYVGYTATPFANIFIDPDPSAAELDLFPRDFIISLDPPTNYFGPEKIFLSDEAPNPWLREIDDWDIFIDPKHKIDYEPENLSPSLMEAIRFYVIAIAIRFNRGDSSKNNSMLINVSRFANVQKKLKFRVQDYVTILHDAILAHSHLPAGGWLSDPIMCSMHDTYMNELDNLGIGWETLLPALTSVIQLIKVKVINSKSPDTLDYAEQSKMPLCVIAIGGFTLSRGLTLDGLSVSYFLRNSAMYDTLMQMGRWFGYRPRYQDLCRIWMTEDAIGWYKHIAESTQELRDEFLQMERNKLTPSQFGLSVRTHPDTLIITARNKMGAATRSLHCSIALNERLIETHAVVSSQNGTNQNIAAFSEFFKVITDGKRSELVHNRYHGIRGILLNDVKCSFVLSLISNFVVHRFSTIAYGNPLKAYINKRLDSELAKWDVFIVSKENGKANIDIFQGLVIGLQERSIGTHIEGGYRIGPSQKISGRGLEKVGLTEDQVAQVEIDAGTSKFSDKLYRRVKGRKPLLVLHLFQLKKANDSSWSKYPIPAWSISLPSTGLAERTEEYIVNRVWQEGMLEFEQEDNPD